MAGEAGVEPAQRVLEARPITVWTLLNLVGPVGVEPTKGTAFEAAGCANSPIPHGPKLLVGEERIELSRSKTTGF